MKENVDILLSTYNGSKYINELIESILKQTYKYIHLIIRDDGSKDNTRDILNNWKSLYPDKISIIQDTNGNIGVTRSMFTLVKKSLSPYVMFCDQDDVWMEDKVSWMVKAINHKEHQYPDIPILVHCDAYTTDKDLKLVSDNEKQALMSYQSGRNKMQTTFANLLLCNPVQGASMIFNRQLVNELEPILNKRIEKTLIYDSIVSSICSIHGKIFFLNRPLMFYRQHAGNVVGAKKTYLYKRNTYNEKLTDAVTTANFLKVNRIKCKLIKSYYIKILDEHQTKILLHYMNSANNWIEFFSLGLYKQFSLKQTAVMMIYGIA